MKSEHTPKYIYTKDEIEKPLVLDCKDVTNLIDHSWDSLFKSIGSLKRQIVFINSSQLEEKINASHNEYSTSVPREKTKYSITIAKGDLEFNEDTNNLINSHLTKCISKSILNSFCLHQDGRLKLLSSTPFYANGEYNASKILSNQKDFIWTSVIFADFIRSVIEERKIGKEGRELRLLSVSLRSTPFAASISLLLRIPLITVEYLGPQRNPIINLN